MSSSSCSRTDSTSNMAEPGLDNKKEDTGMDSTGDTGHAVSFKDLGLKPELLKAIEECGFERPTEVQRKSIPQILSGVDVLCEAGNGMGRRTAIVLAALQQIQPEDGKISTLVLCHTRASARKCAAMIDDFSKHMTTPPRVIALCGGVSVKHDLKALADCPHIVVGTVGRIKMLLSQKSKPLNVADVMHFFIQESNRIIEAKDMRGDLQEIEKRTSRQKQVVMFSDKLKDTAKPLYHGYLKEQNVTISISKKTKGVDVQMKDLQWDSKVEDTEIIGVDSTGDTGADITEITGAGSTGDIS